LYDWFLVRTMQICPGKIDDGHRATCDINKKGWLSKFGAFRNNLSMGYVSKINDVRKLSVSPKTTDLIDKWSSFLSWKSKRVSCDQRGRKKYSLGDSPSRVCRAILESSLEGTCISCRQVISGSFNHNLPAKMTFFQWTVFGRAWNR
jgi:hypothetical protein